MNSDTVNSLASLSELLRRTLRRTLDRLFQRLVIVEGADVQ